jgi:hypothetical protein
MQDAEVAEFYKLDPDLPSIAALAAAEVDEVIHKRNTAFENLSRLAKLLSTSFDGTNRQPGSKRLLDPVSINVVVSTLREAHASKLSSYDELADASLKLANQMKDITEINNEPLLTELKRFCLALSKYSLASKESIYTSSSISKYKR